MTGLTDIGSDRQDSIRKLDGVVGTRLWKCRVAQDLDIIEVRHVIAEVAETSRVVVTFVGASTLVVGSTVGVRYAVVVLVVPFA